jgi:hypothetical protein
VPSKALATRGLRPRKTNRSGERRRNLAASRARCSTIVCGAAARRGYFEVALAGLARVRPRAKRTTSSGTGHHAPRTRANPNRSRGHWCARGAHVAVDGQRVEPRIAAHSGRDRSAFSRRGEHPCGVGISIGCRRELAHETRGRRWLSATQPLATALAQAVYSSDRAPLSSVMAEPTARIVNRTCPPCPQACRRARRSPADRLEVHCSHRCGQQMRNERCIPGSRQPGGCFATVRRATSAIHLDAFEMRSSSGGMREQILEDNPCDTRCWFRLHTRVTGVSGTVGDGSLLRGWQPSGAMQEGHLYCGAINGLLRLYALTELRRYHS